MASEHEWVTVIGMNKAALYCKKCGVLRLTGLQFLHRDGKWRNAEPRCVPVMYEHPDNAVADDSMREAQAGAKTVSMSDLESRARELERRLDEVFAVRLRFVEEACIDSRDKRDDTDDQIKKLWTAITAAGEAAARTQSAIDALETRCAKLEVVVNRGALIDACRRAHELPREAQ